MKLVCIPYAGGTARYFSSLSSVLISNIEIYPVEYAGHGSRAKECICDSFQKMVLDIADEVNNNLCENDDIALFGYSMGSLVAYEMIRQQLIHAKVSHLFVAAHLPPHIFEIKELYSAMEDDVLSEKLIQFGGLDYRLLNNRRFLKAYLKIIRDDYRLLEKYKWKEGGLIETDTSVFYANNDTGRKDILKWKEVISGEVTFYEIKNEKHFFLKDNNTYIGEVINSTLSTLKGD